MNYMEVANNYPIRLKYDENSVNEGEYVGFSAKTDVIPTSLMDEDVHSSVFHVKSDKLHSLIEELSGEGTLIAQENRNTLARTEPAALELSDDAVSSPMENLDSALENSGYDPSYLVCTELRVGMTPDLKTLDQNLSQLNVNIGLPETDIVRMEYDPQREKVYAMSEHQRDIATGRKESIAEREIEELREIAEESGLEFSSLEHSSGHRVDRMLEDGNGSLTENQELGF